jgi:hypothetical protein
MAVARQRERGQLIGHDQENVGLTHRSAHLKKAA